MVRECAAAISLGTLLALNGPALAQDPCAAMASQGASLSGFAGAKTDSLKSGKSTICEMWSKDRTATLKLIVEPPQAASGMAMRKMLAANAKEPGMKVKDEPTLGAGAFSFLTKEQLSLSAVGKGGVYTLSLDRDAGIAPGDEDRVRAIAKQVVEGR
jgi:hypothetical protein